MIISVIVSLNANNLDTHPILKHSYIMKQKLLNVEMLHASNEDLLILSKTLKF